MTTATKRAKGRKAGPRAAGHHIPGAGNMVARGPIPVGARVRIVGDTTVIVYVVAGAQECGVTRYLLLAKADQLRMWFVCPEERCEIVSAPAVAPEPVVVTRAAPVGLWEGAV